MSTANDFIHQPLVIGDWVIFTQLGYRNFWVGQIVKLTDKTVLIKHKRTNTCSEETKQFYSQVIRITYEQVPVEFKFLTSENS